MRLEVAGQEYEVQFSHRRYNGPVRYLSDRFDKRKERWIRGATRCRIAEVEHNVQSPTHLHAIGEGWSRCSIQDAWDLAAAQTQAFGRALEKAKFDRDERTQLWAALRLELDRSEAEQRRRDAGYAEEKGQGSAKANGEEKDTALSILPDREAGVGLSAQQAERYRQVQRSFRC